MNTGPESHETVIAVWVSLVWEDRRHERKNKLTSSGLL